MIKLAKYPKGLKTRLARELKAASRKVQVISRIKEIDAMKKKVADLVKKRRGY